MPPLSRPLTATSHAILGQLALAPRTTYELTKQMRQNLHYFWPRAESRIYDGVKRLVESGLAERTVIAFGRRTRASYELTPAGRDALRAWLDAPPAAGFTLEYEAILRVFLASQASPERLLAAIDRVRADADELFGVATDVGDRFVAGTHPFQDQVHVRSLVFDFLLSVGQAMHGWSERARSEVEAWDSTAVEGKEERARARIAAGLATLER